MQAAPAWVCSRRGHAALRETIALVVGRVDPAASGQNARDLAAEHIVDRLNLLEFVEHGARALTHDVAIPDQGVA